MEFIDDRKYLEPPNNEARVAFKCFFCNGDIYVGDDYYSYDNTIKCCETCANTILKTTAELPDYDLEKADLEVHDLKE